MSPGNLFDRPGLPIAGRGSLFSGPQPPSLWGPGGLFPSDKTSSTRTGAVLNNANTNTIGAGGIFGSGGSGDVDSSTSSNLPQPTSVLPPLLPPLISPQRSRLPPLPTTPTYQQSSDSHPELAMTSNIPAIDALSTLNSPPSEALLSVADRRHPSRCRVQQRKKSYEEVERERRTNLSVLSCVQY